MSPTPYQKSNRFKNAPRSRLISIFFQLVVLKSNSSLMFSSLLKRHQFDCRLSTLLPLLIGSLRLISSTTKIMCITNNNNKAKNSIHSNEKLEPKILWATILNTSKMSLICLSGIYTIFNFRSKLALLPCSGVASTLLTHKISVVFILLTVR